MIKLKHLGDLSILTSKVLFPNESQPKDDVGIQQVFWPRRDAKSCTLTALQRRQRTSFMIKSHWLRLYLLTSFRYGKCAFNSEPALNNMMRWPSSLVCILSLLPFQICMHNSLALEYVFIFWYVYVTVTWRLMFYLSLVKMSNLTEVFRWLEFYTRS